MKVNMKVRAGFLIALTTVLCSSLGFYIGRATVNEAEYISVLGTESLRQEILNIDWENTPYNISIIVDTPEIFVAEKTMKSGLKAHLFNKRKRVLYINHIQQNLSKLGPYEDDDY